MNQSNSSIFQESILAMKKSGLADNVDVWVCVGSRVTNTNKKQSDIDILAFGEDIKEFKRIKESLDNIDVSVCYVPTKMLTEDSNDGLFGGYFAAKLFHPHSVYIDVDNKVLKVVLAAPSRYFLPFINYYLNDSKLKVVSVENLTAMALAAFLSICPDYDSYWLRNVHDKKGRWKQTVKQFEKSLEFAGITYDSSLRQLTGPKNIKKHTFHRDLVDRIARHWSFGTVHHGSNLEFYDWYKSKANEVVELFGGYDGDNYMNMIKFIEDKSGIKLNDKI